MGVVIVLIGGILCLVGLVLTVVGAYLIYKNRTKFNPETMLISFEVDKSKDDIFAAYGTSKDDLCGVLQRIDFNVYRTAVDVILSGELTGSHVMALSTVGLNFLFSQNNGLLSK